MAHGKKKIERDPAGHVTDHVEYRDLNFKAILQFTVGLVILVVFSYISTWGMMKVFQSEAEKNDPIPSPVADTLDIIPGPNIQANPKVDLVDYLNEEDSILQSTGILDAETGRKQVTIDEAMDMVVEEKLPHVTPDEQEEMELAAASQEAESEVSEEAEPTSNDEEGSE